jgi:acyl-coenzyme A thioesterase PaaI-like protein
MAAPEAASDGGELLDAVADLGDALRQALEASTSTTAPAARLREAAAGIRALTAPLAALPRPRDELPAVDDMARAVRVFNPVVGVGSAIAAPLDIRPDPDGGGVLARAELGQRFEGPPTYLHGGISALLMDQVLGYAAIVADRWGMTVDLDVRYRRPVPLHTPLRLTGRVAAAEGRRTTVVGVITTDEAPGVALVEATAIFVSPSAEVTARYFGGVRTAGGGTTSGRLGTG